MFTCHPMVIITRRSRIRERRVPRVCDTAVLRTTITTSTLLSGSFATYSSFASLLFLCFYFTTMAASRGDRKPYNVSNPLFNVLGGPYSLHSDLVLFLCYSLTPLFSDRALYLEVQTVNGFTTALLALLVRGQETTATGMVSATMLTKHDQIQALNQARSLQCQTSITRLHLRI